MFHYSTRIDLERSGQWNAAMYLPGLRRRVDLQSVPACWRAEVECMTAPVAE